MSPFLNVLDSLVGFTTSEISVASPSRVLMVDVFDLEFCVLAYLWLLFRHVK